MDIPQIAPEDLTPKDKLYLALLRFFSRLPLGFLQRFGGFLGWIASLLHNAQSYRVVRKNLELCFPEKDILWHEQTARENLVTTGKVMFEFAKTWGMPTAYSISQIRQVHNERVFFDAINSGRGCIAIIPHFGSWEFMNAWVNQHTAPTIMYKPGKDKGVDTFVLEARGRLRATMVTADERGVKGTLKALKKGGFCAILPDHVPQDNGGLYAPFFGISTWTGVIVPRLIERTGCAVIVMSCLRRADGNGFEVFFDEPDPEIYSSDLQTSATAMNRSIETLIRRAPAEYQWSYKRFKKNEALPDPYQR